MRFPALTHGMETSRSLSGYACVQTSVRTAGASSPRAKRPGRFPWRSGLICLAVCGFLFAFPAFKETGQAALPSASPLAAPLPAWVEIASPREIFRLGKTELAGEAKLYAARRHRTGGGRQDILEFSGSDANVPLLNLLIYQPGNEIPPNSAFYVELARRAAETGRAIVRAEQPVEMATRLGAFEVARLDLAQDGTFTQECLGFRFANLAPSLRITGYACGGVKGLVASPFPLKAALACILDRLDLAPAVEDKGLIDFFAAHYAIPGADCPGPEIDPKSLPPARLLKTSEAVFNKGKGKSHRR